MTVTETTPDNVDEHEAAPVDETESPQVVDEVLVEEISIDGMCGVY